MNTTHLKFSKEHKIIKEVIIEGGKIALKWFNNTTKYHYLLLYNNNSFFYLSNNVNRHNLV